MLSKFFAAGRMGMPMPTLPKKGTGTVAIIVGGSCAATAVVAFAIGRWSKRAKTEAGKE